MRKNISISLICLLFTQSGLQADVDVQRADSVTVRESLNQSAQTHQFNTKYIPPALSLERKSLRIINMQGAAGLPKGEWEMFIQHRFGTFGTGAYNWYGLDQSYMRIGLDAGLSERLTVGVSRSSMNKIADGYFKYQFKGKATASPKKEGDSKSEVTAAWYSNVSINTQARASISPEPFYYTNRLRFVNRLRSAFQEILTKPLWIQMCLKYRELENDEIFKSSIGLRFVQDNIFEEIRRQEILQKRMELVGALKEITDGEEPFFDVTWLIERYLKLDKDELASNQAAKELAAKKKKDKEKEEGGGDEGGGEGEEGGEEEGGAGSLGF